MDVASFYGSKSTKIRITKDTGIIETSSNNYVFPIPENSISDEESDSDSEDEVTSYYLVRIYLFIFMY